MAYKKEVEGGCSSGEITTLGDSQERESPCPDSEGVRHTKLRRGNRPYGRQRIV